MTPLKVIEVTRGHQQLLVNNLRSKWDRDVRLVSLRLSPQGASSDGIIWPTWVTEWPCPGLTWGQLLTLTFQCQIIHGSTRLDETNTIESQSLFYLLKQRRYRRQTILVKFDLLTSGDLNFDLSLKMTEVVSECFLPCFRMPFSVLFYDAQEPR